MGMGLNVEVIQAEPWPPEEPPIAGIPEWFGKYWPALVIVGLGLSLAFFGAPRQKEGYLHLEKKK